MPYLEAYEELSKRRPEGMSGLQPIPLQEIEGWARWFWPLDPRRLIDRILALDAAHRAWVAERAQQEDGNAKG